MISSTTFNRSLDQKDTPSTGLGGKLEVRPPVGGGHTLRFGADYRRSEGDLFEDAYNATTGALTAQRFAGGVNTDLGLFLEDDWELGPVTLTGGVRADRYDDRATATSARRTRPGVIDDQQRLPRPLGLDVLLPRAARCSRRPRACGCAPRPTAGCACRRSTSSTARSWCSR